MKTSENGIQFIESQEGCRVRPYQDSAGNWTIGVGHLIMPGEAYLHEGISEAVAMQLLASDVRTAEHYVNGCNLQFNQAQFDALVDFTFNCGCGALSKLVAHGFDRITSQLPLWAHSGGKVVEGLVKRRAAEIELFTLGRREDHRRLLK